MGVRNMGFKIGIELEGIYSESVLDKFDLKFLGRYKYGDEIFENRYLESVSDGSVTMTHNENFSDPYERELVSKVRGDKKGFFNFLKHLKETSGVPLNEFVEFNGSCGCHVHFSFDGITFKNVPTKRLYQLRRRFFNKISQSNIRSKENILKHYNRELRNGGTNYSPKIDKTWNWYNEKFSEFNLISEEQGHGFEWRAINLYGIQTWEEFFEFWDIVYKILIWFEKTLRKSYHRDNKDKLTLNEEISNAILQKLIENEKYNPDEDEDETEPQNNIQEINRPQGME